MIENENIPAAVENSETAIQTNKLYSMYRSIKDIQEDLKKPIPAKKLKSRKQGGQTIQYIAWFDVVKFLDYYAPGWHYEVRNIAFAPNGRIATTVRITIPCAEGLVYREAIGTEDPESKDNKMYGDVCSNSESMALRRAAAKFGLALYLYDKK